MQAKRALITGISGQDGSYLAEILLEKGYEVHGLLRRSSTPNTSRIEHLLKNRMVFIHMGDMADQGSLERAVRKAQPDEIYNLAAMSHVRHSYDVPAYTVDVTGAGFARLLEVVRQHAMQAKVYQASSSEMFGRVQQTPQTETTPFYPRSPYGCAKAMAFNLGRSYRESYGMQVYMGILFNHESPRRGHEFLSKKVVSEAVAIKLGKKTDKIMLGNLEAKRDWGYAKEYCEWIWRIMQHDTPDDFLIATGETHTVQEWVQTTFAMLDMNWQDHVAMNPDLKRPAEVDLLLGDASKSRRLLGFEPKVKFHGLIEIMVEAELKEHGNVQT